MIAVSNLAWPADREAEALKVLAAHGVTGIEVAPTKIAPWDDLTPALLREHRRRIEDAGFKVSSLQAILFGRPELQLLDDDPAPLAAQMARVGAIAEALGARALVFGAPRNRLPGALPPKAALDRARERFAALGAIVAEHGAVIGIEPVPTAYRGEFLMRWQEVLAMVRAINHPGVAVHLDTACVTLGGGDIAAAITTAAPFLRHFHIAEPELAPFADPVSPHAAAAAALTAAGYAGWRAVEMRETADPMPALDTAAAFARETYG